jgi:hypothetical protein
MNIPKDKNYPADSVQCHSCGGWGCETCEQRGWLTPADHPKGRLCEYGKCRKPLRPNHSAVYCTNDCAHKDA